MGFFILFLISVLVSSGLPSKHSGADSLSDDEAVIALNIKALHNENNLTREIAAEALRRTIARYPSGTSNIRSSDSGEALWLEKISQIKEGMSMSEVIKILQLSPESQPYAIEPSGDARYRVDNEWVVTIKFRNSGKVILGARLSKEELLVYVAPPENYTGTWTTWYVNGQKGHETEYENGVYHGLLTHYHDNGQKWYQQHYARHVGEGPDTGWYRDGREMYSGQYRSGRHDGKWIHWFANGQRQAENNFKDGEYDGLIAEWYENGQMRFEMNYKNGVKDGCEAGWDEQGVLQYQREYKNGSIVDERRCQSH